MKNVAVVAGAALAFSLLAGAAEAGVTYTYTGNVFTSVNGSYTTSDFLTMSFTVPTALAANLAAPSSGSDVSPTSFLFSDGVEMVDNVNATAHNVGSAEIPIFEISTDGNGNITSWYIQATGYYAAGFDITKNGVVVNAFNDVITSSNSPGDVADSAQITGTIISPSSGSNSQEPGAWTVSVVPEPASWAMLILGMAMAGFSARRRREGIAVAA